LALRRKGADPSGVLWPNASIDPQNRHPSSKIALFGFSVRNARQAGGPGSIPRSVWGDVGSARAGAFGPRGVPISARSPLEANGTSARRKTMNSNGSNQGFVITAFWETKPGEEETVAGLLRKFLPEARKEEGVKEFQIHQSVTKPQEFFFYEVFAAETAFAAHQQTEHFKKFILGEAIPKLAKRERSQFRFI
jgi:quinol monooxygenase YgiN